MFQESRFSDYIVWYGHWRASSYRDKLPEGVCGELLGPILQTRQYYSVGAGHSVKTATCLLLEQNTWGLNRLCCTGAYR
jgi:hypothetical protein